MFMPAPLAHLRVLDLTDLRGALAGRILADLGAEVLKVEPPGGDPGRLRPPFAGGVVDADCSLPFLFRNANKRCVRVDLAGPEGSTRLDGLCAGADLLVENLGADARGSLGLGPGEIAARHPELVHVAIADFGLSGPRARWTAEPLCALAASGALYPAGFPDLPPCSLPGYLAHDCASIYAVAGGLAALADRAESKAGQTVEISVQEAALAGLNPWSIPLADYARRFPMLPAVMKRNADGPYQVLRVRDGYLRVLPGNPRHWRKFVQWLGDPEALRGSEWNSALYRIANQDVIRLIASEALSSRSRDEAVAEGVRLGFPITAVHTPDEFVAHPQTRTRGFFQKTAFRHLENAPFAPLPCNFSRTSATLRCAPPHLEDARGGFASPREVASTPRSRRSVAHPPLEGVLVIGLTCGAVGPEACGLLADLGADVIKIESRTNLDFLRQVSFDDDPNHSWTFNDECRGQQSVCLDLSTPRGREIALALCAQADVVIETNRGGVAAALGLDYEDVARVNPRVVYLCSQGFGRGGPLGEAPSFGPLNSTFAGVNWLWNHETAPYPAGISLNYPDHIASKLAAAAVLAALEDRRRTGEGQRVEMSQAEAAAYLAGEFYLQGPTTGRPPEPRGNFVEYAAPHGVYPCAGEDRWLAVAVTSDEAFEELRAVCGWPHDPALVTLAGRLNRRVDLDERLSRWTRSRDADAAAAELQAAGVSAMTVQHGDDHRADTHLAARGAIIAVEHPEIGSERHAANPIRLSRAPLSAARAAPLLGADTRPVLQRLLGLSPDEIAALVTDGVCC
jgi:crotonobetainyl-CoA:carnitine CoA-transferase CaiB-like acyl-CoA transferase